MVDLCKIYDLVSVVSKVRTEKNSHNSIVACCGCFDVFHTGHLEYLSFAKKLGDILVVGVNSDDSYKGIKNKEPMFDVKSRMSILEALYFVNYVFSFDETTFCHSLKILAPDIFAVGIDKANIIMAEESICKINNINFIHIGTKKITSSTHIKSYFST